MYEDGAIFNKGKAINEGIKSLKNPEWILLLDADIYLQSDFLEVLENTNLPQQNLIVCKRLILDSYELFLDFMNNKDVGRLERAKGFGYFQMFNIKNFSNSSNIFPENSNDAAWSDITFRDRFNKNETELNTTVLHLGQTCQNWEGRKTEKFIEGEFFLNENEQSFDINKYFDKIYCINLENRQDRWIKNKREFNQKSIEVERFEAINGLTISDEEFNSLLDKYNPNRLTGESASLNGLIENKSSLGCLLSHIEVIKKAKINNYKRILIFEDDIMLSNDFSESIKRISKLDWGIVYLGASQFNWKGIEEKDGFYLCKNTLGTFAYAIDSSMYDDIINLLETKRKSVDNLLSEIQLSNYGKCYTFYPNIVISNVEESDIRDSKDIITYSNLVKWNLSNFDILKKLKILLLPDVKDWAFDNIAKSIIKYNPYPDKIEYTIKYSRDIHQKRDSVVVDDWDLIFVMWEAERCIPDGNNVIRGCYSAFWLENSNYSEEVLARYFSKCKGGVFANDYLYKSLGKYLPTDFNSEIIHDSTDENLFYPIDNQKNKNFTAIFVGNTERPIKNFNDIKWICEKSKIELIVCKDIKNIDLVNYYNKADICINFSTFEGGPQTFLESSLCEVPMLIRSNNELSKLIPCFTGSTKEELVDIINYLKLNRSKCLEVGKKARIEVLEKFTYKKTANKFANFFIQTLLNKKDLSNDLTIFIIRAGENPNYEDCLNSLNNQTVKFQIKEIRNIAPMSKAFQKMIDDCETKYYIQVDEDMILEENTIEKIYKKLVSSESNISTIAHMLKDTHLDFNLYGIKGYKHNILKNYPYNLDIISCEVEQVKRMKNDGYETMMVGEVVGKHSPKWTTSLIYERYFDLMEKWKNFKYDWLGELPSKLFQIFQNDPSEINLYALMGAMTSMSSKEMIRKREKNFLIKDENFERIENILQVKEFKFIVNK
jgi:GR25 family glycosyltransferase involved in LPS biosynthesis